MTLFGGLWLLIIGICFFNKSIKPLVLITLIGMLWQCNNMINFGTLSCGPQVITSVIFILRSYFCKNPIKIELNKNIKKIIIIWSLFIIYILAIHIYKDINLSSLLNITMIIIYLFTFYRMIKISPTLDKKFINNCIKIISCIIIAIGVIQLIIIYFDIPRNILMGTLVYNDVENSANIAFYSSDRFRFYSTFMEPSYIASLLVGLFTFLLINTKKHNLLKIFLALSIILTFSSTAYLILFLSLIYYLLKNYKKKSTYLYLIIGITSLIIIGITTNILDTVIFEKLSSSSGITRSLWNNRALSVFLSNPVFGIGYLKLRASSIILDILGELGIIGITFYSLFIFTILKIFLGNKSNEMLKVTSFMVLNACVSQIIACPDLNLCSFWLIMYIFALTTYLKEEDEIWCDSEC